MVLISFYSSHNIRIITTLQLWEMSACKILPLIYFPVSPSIVFPLWLREGVKVYLIGYILYIIDCYIYQDIFDTIDIMYWRVSYVSGCILPSRLLYSIYTGQETHNTIEPTIIHNLLPTRLIWFRYQTQGLICSYFIVSTDKNLKDGISRPHV
jgi:hypothetical protein